MLDFCRRLMDNSVFFRLTDMIVAFFKRLFAGSVLGRFLSKPFGWERLEKEAAGERPIDEVQACERAPRYKSGVFAGAAAGFFDALAAFGRGKGAVLAGHSAFWRLLSELDGFLAQSALISWVYRLCGVKFLERRFEKYRALPVFAAVAAACAAAAMFFVPPAYAGLGAAGVLGALLAAAHPEFGVLAVAGLLPFLPTMLTAALIGYVIFCFFLNLLTGRVRAAVDPTGLAVAALVMTGLFCGLTSFTPSASIKIALLTALFMLSYPLLVSIINTREKISALIFTFSASAAVTGLVGMYQKLSGKVDMTWVDRREFADLRLRVYSTFANPNVYGTYLLLALPLAAVMAYASKRVFTKAVYLGISLLLLVNLAYTYSRGCYLALAFAAFVFVLLTAKRLVAFFLAALALSPFVLPSSMLQRITTLSDSSTSYRIYIWQATVRILRDFWFSGLGQGISAYNVAYPFYAFANVVAPHSHNLYLQVFVETGIFGLLVFLALLAVFYKTQLPFVYGASGKTKALCAGVSAAVAGFLFQGMFDYVFYNYKVMLAFFVFLGIGGAAVRLGREPDGS
ncbi:MAG: O-antigen ligase family protein [Firmicutes bacterium]|nr:O-antigen ligase family protein [Bacillota bacterium]